VDAAVAASPYGTANPDEVEPRLKTGFDLSKLTPSLISHLGEPELKFMPLCDLDTSVSQFSSL